MKIKAFILVINLINATTALVVSRLQTKKILRQTAKFNRLNTSLLALLSVLAVVTSFIQSKNIVKKVTAKQS
jgi:hypothetical protein